jgi:hypothetical protein
MKIDNGRNDLLTTIGLVCLLGVVGLILLTAGLLLSHQAGWSKWGVLVLMGICYGFGRLHAMAIEDRRAQRLKGKS